MARVTATEVKEIMDGCTTSDNVVESFISASHELVDQVFSDDIDIGDTMLKEIERWFTAHMIASTVYRTTSEEKVGDAQAKYTGYWGKGLDSTPYGQMVKILDTTGKMARAGKTAASIYGVISFDE